MVEEKSMEKEVALEKIISAAVQIKGVKVDRKKILGRNFC